MHMATPKGLKTSLPEIVCFGPNGHSEAFLRPFWTSALLWSGLDPPLGSECTDITGLLFLSIGLKYDRITLYAIYQTQ